MRVATAHSLARAPDDAADEIARGIRPELGGDPDLLVVHASATFDIEGLRLALIERFPRTPIHGATSCLGAMTQRGFHSEDGHGVAVMGLSDPDGAYGVGFRPLGDDPFGSASAAAAAALENAGRPGEMPTAVLVVSAPGTEEAVLRGIERVVGSGVPILGGSAADNTVSGGWKQFDRQAVGTSHVVVTALFPSTDVYFAFHSGYEPTAHTGRVTAASGRSVLAIDGRPAARVYAEWVGGGPFDDLPGGGNVLSRTSLHPLGRLAGSMRGTRYYQLSHPDSVTADGALTLFTDVAVGDEFVLMTGTPDGLVERAGRVARAALRTYDASSDDVAGGLVVYCAGCMLAVQSRLDEVVSGLRGALPDLPFVGTFTFGEQGCFPGGENRHGNLMISVLLFARS